MRNINFKKVTMKNFGPYIDEMEVSLDGNKLTIITGPNGVGKTLLFDSIGFTLYGMTSKGQKSDAVVNNVIEKNCKTSVEFSINDNGNVIEYKVVRYQKHSKHGNTVLLYKDDFTKPIKKGHREVVLEIEKLLLPRTLFFNTLFFGQNVKNLFSDIEDSKKKEIFKQILNLGIYEKYKEETKIQINQLNEDVINNKNDIEKIQLIIDMNINQLDEYHEMEKRFKQEQSKCIMGWENDNIGYKKLNDGIKKDIDKINKFINEYEDVDIIYEKVQKLKLNVETLSNEINSIDKKYDDEIFDKISKLNESCESQLKIIKNNLDKEFNEIDKKNNDDTNNIKKQYDEKYNIVKLLESDIDEKNKSIILNIQQEKNSVDKEKENIDKTYNALVNDFNNNTLKCGNEKNILDNNIFELNNTLDNNNQKIQDHKIEKEKYEKSICNDSESKCPTCDSIITDEKIKQRLLNQIKTYNDNIITLENNNIKIIEELNICQINFNDYKIKMVKIEDEFKNKENIINDEKLKIKNRYKLLESKYEETMNQYREDISNVDHKKKMLDELKEKMQNRIYIIQSDKKKQLDKGYKKSKIEIINNKTTTIHQIESELNNKKEMEKKELIKDVNETIVSQRELNTLYNDIKNNKTELTLLTNQVFENSNKILFLEEQLEKKTHEEFKEYDKINKIKIEIKENQNRYKELENDRYTLNEKKDILEFWGGAFNSTGIPSMLIDESIPFLNSQISHYMELLSDSRYMVSFDTLSETKSGEFRDKIQVNVYDNITKANNITQFSGGQKRLVDIGIILTISDLYSMYHNVKFNFVIFDEIFDSLDDQNIKNTIVVLKKLSDEKKVFVITHQYVDELDVLDCDEILKL